MIISEYDGEDEVLKLIRAKRGKMPECPKCKMNTYIELHQMSHKKEYPYYCRICRVTFK